MFDAMPPGAALYYGAIIALMGAIIVFMLAIRQVTWALFAVMGIIFAVALMMNDQFVTGQAWFGFEVNGDVWFTSGHFAQLFGFLVIWCAIDRRAPIARWRWLVPFLAALNLAGYLVGLGQSGFVRTVIINTSMVIMLFTIIIPVRSFEKLGGGRDWAVWTGVPVLIFAALLTLAPFVEVQPFGISDWVTHARVIFVTCLIYATSVALGRVFAIERERRRGLEAQIVAAERDAELSRALFEAERAEAEARALASSRAARLAEASHDIKQPIGALRMQLDAAMAEAPEEVKGRLREAFDYMEGLASSYVEEVRAAPAPGPREEMVPLSTILGALDRMFRSEAEGRGLGFEVSPSDAQTPAKALVVMRILSNLVTNAVRHATPGWIRLEVILPETDRLVLRVSNTAKGLGEADLAALRGAWAKGAASDGDGLGLAIIERLAKENGLGLKIGLSAPGVFAAELELPKG